MNWLFTKNFDAQEDAQATPAQTNATSGKRVVSLKSQSGRIFYTTDGSDPRAFGGTIAKGAVEYRAPLLLVTNQVLTARVRSEFGLWSAPLKIRGDELAARGE